MPADVGGLLKHKQKWKRNYNLKSGSTTAMGWGKLSTLSVKETEAQPRLSGRPVEASPKTAVLSKTEDLCGTSSKKSQTPSSNFSRTPGRSSFQFPQSKRLPGCHRGPFTSS